MTVIALVTWVFTVLAGLFLLAIWLIEYDPDFQRAAATRLPVPVISSHAVLALSGLAVWVSYLITGDDRLAYATLAILIGVAALGIMMAVRWLKVYQTTETPAQRAVKALAVPSPAGVGAGNTPTLNGDLRHRRNSTAPVRASSDLLVPPERHFPMSVVIGHGIFAVTTVVLVLLTVIGIGAN